MRVTKYVKSDGESWVMVKMRCSAHVAYERLDKMMRENGWIRWTEVKAKFDEIKKQLFRQDPHRYTDWKAVKIPMRAAVPADYPKAIREENEAKNV